MYLTDKKGKTWKLNLENTRQLCYAYRRSIWLSRAIVSRHISSVNLGWRMEMTTIEVNWKGIRNSVQAAADNDVFNFWHDKVPADGREAAASLTYYRNATRSNLAIYQRKLRESDANNRKAIERMKDNAENTRKIGEVAAGGLIACSSLLTGGLATTALVGGGALKGVFKYQDKGEVGTALVEAGLEIGVGILGLKSMKGVSDKIGEGVICWVIKPGSEFIKSVVDGDSIPQAAASAFVEGLGGYAGDKGKELVKDFSKSLKDVPVSLTVATVLSKTRGSAEAIEVAGDMAYSVKMDKDKGAAKDAAKSEVGNKRPHTTKNFRFIDASFINRRTQPTNDEKYVNDFCLRLQTGK